jgi:hypothetical protein
MENPRLRTLSLMLTFRLSHNSGATYITFSSGGASFSSRMAAGSGQGTSGGNMAAGGMELETTGLGALVLGSSVDGGWIGLLNGLGTEEVDDDCGKESREASGSFRVAAG